MGVGMDSRSRQGPVQEAIMEEAMRAVEAEAEGFPFLEAEEAEA